VLGPEGLELLAATYRQHHFASHSHSYSVFAVTESGACAITSPGGTTIQRRGDVLMIPPEVLHSAHAIGSAEWRYRALYVSRDAFQRRVGGAADAKACSDVAVIRDARLFRRFADAHRASECDRGAGGAVASLLDDLCGRAAEQCTGLAAGGLTDAVRHAKECIDCAPLERWSLHRLAAEYRTNRFKLCRSFSAQVGTPLHAYALQRRVSAARDHLVDDRSIAGIAQDFGFADQSHFSRSFLSVFGVSPGEFRQGARGGASDLPAAPYTQRSGGRAKSAASGG